MSSSSLSVSRRPLPPLRWLAAALVLLGAAAGLGLLIVELLMSPPAGEVRSLALYLVLSGAATLAGGWAALRLVDRAARPGIRVRAFVASAIGGVVGLLNILVIAHLMFVSTSHDLQLLAAVMAFSAVLTVFFSLWAASLVAGRVRQVMAMVGWLSAGDYGRRIAVEGGDEVARLAMDVNRLADRLREAEEHWRALEEERRHLTAAISHDLRTPLASIRAMAEALDDGVVDGPRETARYYRAIRREVERLNVMINDLFELAQMDAGALRLDLRRLSVAEVAAEVVDAMQPQAQERGVQLTLVASGPAESLIDGARVERAVANLVRNALEHTPSNGCVEVGVTTEGEWVALSVRDNGEGISGDDLPRVWERFFRAERSRRRDTDSAQGAGLGLAIVRGVVEAHGGEVSVESRPGQGSRFTIHLPAALGKLGTGPRHGGDALGARRPRR